MDRLLKTLKEIKEIAKFKGSTSELTQLDDFHLICKKLKVLPVNLKPAMIPKENWEVMIEFLTELTHKYILENNIDSWDAFARNSKTVKISKILYAFGIKGEVFPLEDEGERKKINSNDKTLTLMEFYELCQIKFNYDGSLGSFKKMITNKYGSFAEYCLSKGYSINTTKWESDETAIRVALKIGSVEAVKSKSASLYKYLDEKKLIKIIFTQKAS